MKNKRLYLFIFPLTILCLFSQIVVAQTNTKIHKIEYFFNSDPGFGNGTLVNVNPARTNLNNFNFNAVISSLPKGIHQLFIRCLDSSNNWSQTTSQLFYKELKVVSTVSTMAGSEYFYNTDPGFGNAIPKATGGSVDVTYTFSPTMGGSIPKGLNRFYVRTKDNKGNWSHTSSLLFYKEPAVTTPTSNITKAEYFFDTDPGFGNAIPVAITAGQDITFPLSGSISALTKGLHRLYVRVKNADNKWSLTSTQLFYKEPAVSSPVSPIVKAEYFFDTDPGFGNGISTPVTPGEDINFAINGNISSLDKGLHTLYIRVKDANNKWSLTHSQLFYRELINNNPIPDIVAAEYFIDTDPGFSNGFPMAITSSREISELIDIPVYGLSKGFHRLYIRVRDANNNWSITNTSLFYYEAIPGISALSDLVKLEWFWNTDPGFGNATKVSLPAGNNSQISDFVFAVPAPDIYSNTRQHFYLRTLEADWSLTSVKVIDFTGIVLPVTLLEFKARETDKEVLTSWTTAQEINLKHFEVEHSSDGINFVKLGIVTATGSNASVSNYSFPHSEPVTGDNFYRLKQVDINGSFTYSPIVKINFSGSNKMPIAYPNPVKDVLNVSIPASLISKGNLILSLFDSKSSLIKRSVITESLTQLVMSNLSAGSYVLIITDEKSSFTWKQKIIKR